MLDEEDQEVMGEAHGKNVIMSTRLRNKNYHHREDNEDRKKL